MGATWALFTRATMSLMDLLVLREARMSSHLSRVPGGYLITAWIHTPETQVPRIVVGAGKAEGKEGDGKGESERVRVG